MLDAAEGRSVSTDEANFAIKAAELTGKRDSLREILQWVELRLSQDPEDESPPEV